MGISSFVDSAESMAWEDSEFNPINNEKGARKGNDKKGGGAAKLWIVLIKNTNNFIKYFIII